MRKESLEKMYNVIIKRIYSNKLNSMGWLCTTWDNNFICEVKTLKDVSLILLMNYKRELKMKEMMQQLRELLDEYVIIKKTILYHYTESSDKMIFDLNSYWDIIDYIECGEYTLNKIYLENGIYIIELWGIY